MVETPDASARRLTTPKPARATRLGRPPAIPDDELRDRMFAAAGEMIEEAGGFSLSTENVQLEAVMRRANVSRSAVYRVWPSKEDFTFDLLQAFASDGSGGVGPFGDEGRAKAGEVMARHQDSLNTSEGRRAAMVDAIREVARDNFHLIIASRRWRRYPALAITADALDAERAEAVLDRMRATEEKFYREYEEFYSQMFAGLGLRAKTPFTDENAAHVLTRLTIALFEGLALQHTVNPDVGDTVYPAEATPDNTWILPAAGFLALVDGVCEPVPTD